MTTRAFMKSITICVFIVALAAGPGMARDGMSGQGVPPSGQEMTDQQDMKMQNRNGMDMQDREDLRDSEQNYDYGPDWQEGHKGEQRQRNLEGRDYGPTAPGMQRDYYGPDPKGGPEGLKELPPNRGGGIDEGNGENSQNGRQEENGGMF